MNSMKIPINLGGQFDSKHSHDAHPLDGVMTDAPAKKKQRIYLYAKYTHVPSK